MTTTSTPSEAQPYLLELLSWAHSKLHAFGVHTEKPESAMRMDAIELELRAFQSQRRSETMTTERTPEQIATELREIVPTMRQHSAFCDFATTLCAAADEIERLRKSRGELMDICEQLSAENARLRAGVQAAAKACGRCAGRGVYLNGDGTREDCRYCAPLRALLNSAPSNEDG